MQIVFENPVQTQLDFILQCVWWIGLGLSTLLFMVAIIEKSQQQNQNEPQARFTKIRSVMLPIAATLTVLITVGCLYFGERVVQYYIKELPPVAGVVESCDIQSSFHSNVVTLKLNVEGESISGRVEYVIPDSDYPLMKNQRRSVPPALQSLSPGTCVTLRKFWVKDGDAPRYLLFLNPN
jgi:hypothetical protein